MQENDVPAEEQLERNLRRLILRQVSDGERDAIEEQLFADDEQFIRALEIEGDVIDGYARGTLRDGERATFEELLSRDERLQRRVQFARALGRKVMPPHSNVVAIESSPRWSRRRLAYVAAAAVLTPLLAIALYRSREELPAAAPQQARKIPAVVAPPAARPSERIVSVALTLATVRGDEARPVVDVGGADVVRLKIALDPAETYETYEVLVDAGGNSSRALGFARREGDAITIDAPADAFPEAGRYELTVRGRKGKTIETIGFLQLDVTRS